MITARTWRVIASSDYENKIPAGTLCRFAKAKGEWLPKEEYLYVLGLKKQRATIHKPKMLIDMSTDELLFALNNRQPMPKVSTKFKKLFKQLGYKNIRAGAR